MAHLFVFPDTNFFLHFVHPSQAPWAELGPASEIRLVVTSTIQREIDKKKHELSGRPHKRARDFAAIFTSSALSGDEHVFRDHGPRVTLEHFLRPSTFSVPVGLSVADWGDDAFVADVLAFMEAQPDARVLLVSGDGGALLTAKRFGVPYHHLKGSKWDLPPEPDRRDAELTELRRRNEELLRTGPSIQGRFQDIGGSDRVETQRVMTRRLTRDETDLLIGELMALHPRQEDFITPPDAPPTDGGTYRPPSGLGYKWSAPTGEAIQAYRTAYGEWLDQARRLVASLSDRLAVPETSAAATLILENDGVEPGQGVTVRFRTSPGLLLRFPSDQEADEPTGQREPRELSIPRLTPPPTVPAWKKLWNPSPSSTPLAGVSGPSGPTAAAMASALGMAGYDPAGAAAHGFNWSPLQGVLASTQAMRAAGMFGPSLASDPTGYRSVLDGVAKHILPGVLGFTPPDHASLIAAGLRSESARAAAGSTFPDIADYAAAFRPSTPNPHAFYFEEGSKGQETCLVTVGCQEFRHRNGPEEFSFEVFFGPDAPQQGGEVRVEIYARNLREPVKLKLAVIRRTRHRDAVSDARVALGLRALPSSDDGQDLS